MGFIVGRDDDREIRRLSRGECHAETASSRSVLLPMVLDASLLGRHGSRAGGELQAQRHGS